MSGAGTIGEQAPDTQAQSETDAIGADLAGAEAVRAVKRLQHAWGHYADAGDHAAMADLFAPDGHLVLGARRAHGREEILALLDEEFGAPGVDRLDVRLMMSPVVTVSSDRRTARARWHELAVTGRYTQSAGWAGGIQENHYAAIDGVWRITLLHHHPQFAGTHRDGWRNLSDDVPLVPFHFTPDQAGTPVPPGVGEHDVHAADARAQRLVDESLVQNLVAAYGQYVDRKLWDDVSDLFGESGALAWGSDRWEGRAAVRDGLEQYAPAGLRHGELHDHLQLMPVVTIAPDGRTARARVLELQSLAVHGERATWGVRVGEGRFEKVAGTWRIAELVYTPRLLADHATGWADDVAPAGPAAYPAYAGPAADFAHPVREPLRFAAGEAPSTSLRQTVDTALAFDAAENVAYAYGYFLDEAHWDESADLFARDGWKELSFIGTYIGREHIRASLIARYGRRPRRPTFLPIHQKTQPYITVRTDGRVQIRLKMLQVNSGWDVGASTVAGVYEEQVIQEDGIWRIHGMDLEYIVVADWDGWAEVTPEAGRKFAPTDEAIAAFDPQPDGPLRGLSFAPYPEIGPLGFHYANPVSGREPALRFDWSDGHFDQAPTDTEDPR